MSNFVEALEKRHSQYNLRSTSKLSDDELVDLIERVTVAVPSGFNIQAQRIVLLFGQEHSKLWNDIVKGALREVADSDEGFAKTSAKIDTFAAAHGTVLYFDDVNGVKQLSEQFPTYADAFPTYAQQAQGMLQLAVWSALSEAGLGASLQHYNPLIDEGVHNAFDIPENWRLTAQMPFGDFETPTGNTERMPASDRVTVLGR
jgi:uncharacterized protein